MRNKAQYDEYSMWHIYRALPKNLVFLFCFSFGIPYAVHNGIIQMRYNDTIPYRKHTHTHTQQKEKKNINSKPFG